MKRREAIYNIALASTACMFMTGCADKNVADFLVDGKLQLNPKHLEYLGAISETLVPVKAVSDKIGSSVDFIMSMVNDCTSAEDIQSFVSGFEGYKLLMKENSLKIKSSKAEDILKFVKGSLEEEAPKDDVVLFINKVKDLSVRNFTTSEYFLTEKRDYKMIPDPYQACVTI